MDVVVHEVDETVGLPTQKITVGAKPIMVYALRPYIFKWLAPAGTVYMQIQDVNRRKIVDSESITITAISAQNYFHGYYRFLTSAHLRANTNYYIAMKTSGYTYNSNAFVGWANSFALGNTFEASYDDTGLGATGIDAPLGLQIWAYKFTQKGDA